MHSNHNKSTEKPYHHGNLRCELIEAACELLEKSNITSLSLRQVAKKVGVSHTAPYRHFPDKEDLLAAIAARGFKRLSNEMRAAGKSNPGDPAAQLRDAGCRYVRLALKYPQCTQLMFSGILPCDETQPELLEISELAFDGLKILIEAGKSHGVFKDMETDLLSLSAWSSMHGLSMLLTSGRLGDVISDPVESETLASAVSGLVLDGIRRYPPGHP